MLYTFRMYVLFIFIFLNCSVLCMESDLTMPSQSLKPLIIDTPAIETECCICHEEFNAITCGIYDMCGKNHLACGSCLTELLKAGFSRCSICHASLKKLEGKIACTICKKDFNITKCGIYDMCGQGHWACGNCFEALKKKRSWFRNTSHCPVCAKPLINAQKKNASLTGFVEKNFSQAETENIGLAIAARKAGDSPQVAHKFLEPSPQDTKDLKRSPAAIRKVFENKQIANAQLNNTSSSLPSQSFSPVGTQQTASLRPPSPQKITGSSRSPFVVYGLLFGLTSIGVSILIYKKFYDKTATKPDASSHIP